MNFYSKLYFSTLQEQEFFQFTDILNAVTASDSECEVFSSDESSDDDDLCEIGAKGDSNNADDVGDDADEVGDNHDDDNSDGDSSYSDGVPPARQKKKKPKQHKFETRRPFIPPDLPHFYPRSRKSTAR